jgi:hypothetical protein
MDWINLGQNLVQRRAVVNSVMNLRVPYDMGNTLLTRYGLCNPHKELPSMESPRRAATSGTRYLITEVCGNGH